MCVMVPVSMRPNPENKDICRRSLLIGYLPFAAAALMAAAAPPKSIYIKENLIWMLFPLL